MPGFRNPHQPYSSHPKRAAGRSRASIHHLCRSNRKLLGVSHIMHWGFISPVGGARTKRPPTESVTTDSGEERDLNPQPANRSGIPPGTQSPPSRFKKPARVLLALLPSLPTLAYLFFSPSQFLPPGLSWALCRASTNSFHT